MTKHMEMRTGYKRVAIAGGMLWAIIAAYYIFPIW